MTRRPSGITSLPMPSPGMTAMRYCFLLLIENFLVTCRAGSAAYAGGPCNEPISAAAQRCSAMLTAPHSPYSFPPSLLENPVQQERKSMDLHLRGKRVLITGASKGIGAAAAEA